MAKTYVVKEGDVTRQWFVVDAAGKTLGRLASEIAVILQGKHKPVYSANRDVGDFVIVVNASEISVTGRKLDQKMYYRHTGYPGGLKSITLRDQMKRRPTHAVRAAVRGMMPKSKLGRKMLSKLKVYAGPDHPHEAQQPQALEI